MGRRVRRQDAVITVLRGLLPVVAVISIVGGVVCVTIRIASGRFADDRDLLAIMVLAVAGSVATVLKIWSERAARVG